MIAYFVSYLQYLNGDEVLRLVFCPRVSREAPSSSAGILITYVCRINGSHDLSILATGANRGHRSEQGHTAMAKRNEQWIDR